MRLLVAELSDNSLWQQRLQRVLKKSLITVKYDQQATLAKDLGADHVVNIGETDPNEYVKDITGGRGMDAVIETVGGGHNFDAAMDMVRSCGVVVLVAGYYEPLKVHIWGASSGRQAIVTIALIVTAIPVWTPTLMQPSSSSRRAELMRQNW